MQNNSSTVQGSLTYCILDSKSSFKTTMNVLSQFFYGMVVIGSLSMVGDGGGGVLGGRWEGVGGRWEGVGEW